MDAGSLVKGAQCKDHAPTPWCLPVPPMPHFDLSFLGAERRPRD